MGTINPNELAFVEIMKREGVFLPLDPTKRNLKHGITAVPCADCDQRRDLIGNLESWFEDQGLEPRVHALSLNGGALGIPLSSPLNPHDHKGQSLLMDIGGTARPDVKGIELVGLYGHYPCGAAGLASLTLQQCIDLLMQAESRVKATFPNFRVHAFYHIDRGEHFEKMGYQRRRVTYFVSHRAYLSWKERLHRSAPSHPSMDRDPSDDRTFADT